MHVRGQWNHNHGDYNGVEDNSVGDTPPPPSLCKVDSCASIQRSEEGSVEAGSGIEIKEMEIEDENEEENLEDSQLDDEDDDQDEGRDEFHASMVRPPLRHGRRPSWDSGPPVAGGCPLPTAKAAWLESGALEPKIDEHTRLVSQTKASKTQNKLSFRRDPPFDFTSRYVLNKPFCRLRDLKSTLEMDLLSDETKLDEQVTSWPPHAGRGATDLRASRRAKDGLVSSKMLGSDRTVHSVLGGVRDL